MPHSPTCSPSCGARIPPSELYEYIDRLPPLPLVGAFLQRQGFHLERLIARFPSSRFVSGSRAKRVRLQADGRVAVGLGRSHPADDLVGASAILALGGVR